MSNAGRRRRITIMNDSEEFLQLAELLLDERGPYAVTTLRTDEATVERIVGSSPELVIVDIGSEESAQIAFRLARADEPALRGIPVLLTTPTGQLSERLLAAAGARVHHLPKPFTGQALEDVVRRLLP